tara:strand:+ start:222 stop:536 length:315 start_codon:yes stop_codon:yes gene_type:complete
MDKNEIFNWWCETRSKHYVKNRPTHAWKVLSNCYKMVYVDKKITAKSLIAQISREGFENELNNEIKRRREIKIKSLLKEQRKERRKKEKEKFRYMDYRDQFDQI